MEGKIGGFAPRASAGGDMAPARRRALLALLSAMALIPACVLFLDRPLATLLHARLHGVRVFVWLTWIADAPAPLAVLCLAAAGLAFLAGRPPSRGSPLVAAAVATLLALALKDTLKYGFGRLWPETWINNNPSWIGTGAYGFHPFHGGMGWASFPSGHTTAIAAPCATLWPRLPRLRPLLALLTLAVAVGLLGADYHFLGDVLGGLYLGAAAAAATLALAGGPA